MPSGAARGAAEGAAAAAQQWRSGDRSRQDAHGRRSAVPRLPPLKPAERRLVQRLRTPEQVQAWLNGLPYNWERRGPTVGTLRTVLRRGSAHCLEAALCAAAILERHGYPPLLVDIESTDRLDHVLFVFRRNGRWGAVARSRAPGLHGRKPVFRSIPALVRSYMPAYIDQTGRVKGWGLLDLGSLDGSAWRTGTRNQWHVEEALRRNRHHRLRTPERLYRRWKRAFDVWWEAEGRPVHRWPEDYPGKQHWLWP